MFSTQLEHIQKQTNKALGVFNKTRVSLLKTIDQANQCIHLNEVQIFNNEEQNQELRMTNNSIINQVSDIRKSLGQIDSILGSKNQES